MTCLKEYETSTRLSGGMVANLHIECYVWAINIDKVFTGPDS